MLGPVYQYLEQGIRTYSIYVEGMRTDGSRHKKQSNGVKTLPPVGINLHKDELKEESEGGDMQSVE